MKKLPIGIQTFQAIIEDDDFYYVDKTKFVYDLVESGRYYFLSRPRRFGKSLFLDTLRAAFSGERELFKGLYLEENWDWETKYPVINISFGSGVMRSVEELQSAFLYMLDKIQKQYTIHSDYTDLSSRFSDTIYLLNKKYNQKVVILIDEYDKPILDSIDKTDLAIEIREELKNYYSVIKDSDRYIKFVFITGVTKFSKVSLFSGLNNLEDLTLHSKYSAICGYTQGELEDVFAERLVNQDLDKIKNWYNGYSFLGDGVYNPFDILLFFSNSYEFKNFWFETATPTFLIKLLMAQNYFIPSIEEIEANDDILSSFDVDKIGIETLLFQAGYLTIKDKKQKGNRIIYNLGYPNLEVKMSMTDYILKMYSDQNVTGVQNRLYDYLESGDLDKLKDLFYQFFASIPNDWYRKNQIAGYEGYYASIFYCYFTALGLDVIAEDITNIGRIDLTVRIEDKIYIIEFKVIELIKEKNSALEQIKEKRYYEKYQDDKSDIYLVGVEFSKDEKNITRYDYLKMDGKTL